MLLTTSYTLNFFAQADSAIAKVAFDGMEVKTIRSDFLVFIKDKTG